MSLTADIENWGRETCFEDNHKTGLKHMEHKVLIGLLRGCPLDTWMYRAGVEVRSGNKKNLFE